MSTFAEPSLNGPLVPLVDSWSTRRGVGRAGGVSVVEAEVLLPGRPGLIDVVASVGPRTAHLVLGLHRLSEGPRTLGGARGEDALLGELDDGDGRALVTDALRDAELAPRLLEAVTGKPAATVVSIVRDDDLETVLLFADRYSFTVYPWLPEGPHPGVELLVGLDEAGFNHLAAPLVLWRRQGRDLGLVQEALQGSADGWALALTSLRDLYGSGADPEVAGGDFASEARSLGTMMARLHVASERSFGRQTRPVAHWVREVEAVVAANAPELLAVPRWRSLIDALASSDVQSASLRTHGDFHLGRTARTDQGWVLADCAPGGVDERGEVLFRSPLADVADMLWSFHHVAATTLDERDLAAQPQLEGLADAWEARNQRAFLTSYLRAPGIGALVPADSTVLDQLVRVFELERQAVSAIRAPA
jgi:maltokinase